MEVDYIIVGQGIAGSMLAYFLLQKNKKVVVIDKFNPNSASNIAAGVVNPITGRKMVKTWRINEFLPFAKSTYKQIEREFSVRFFYEEEIKKIITSEEDTIIWNNRKQDKEYQSYLGNISENTNKNILAPFGIGTIQKTCWMDVPVFISTYRDYLAKNNLIIEEEFDYNDLEILNTIQYKNIKSKQIIFCEGYKVHQNPYFNFIPFSFAKGEQFIIKAATLHLKNMISKNIFILPLEVDTYSVGATFVWNDLSENMTENGREELKEKLNKIINCTYSIEKEKAGIRPTIKDRRPVMGEHPSYKNMHIFNGMGTKGVSLAPYMANHFSDCLINNTEIDVEVSINRFIK